MTGEDNYPPYNIERTGEDKYQISLALAGFTPEEIAITAEQNVLTVEGRKAKKGDHQYLYQGISARPFRRTFNLAEYVQVKGASFEQGLLKIKLAREVPDAWPTTPQQAIDISLERRIENALMDLEVFNARALKVDAQAKEGTLERRIEDPLKDLESATIRTLKADEERLNALARKTGVDR